MSSLIPASSALVVLENKVLLVRSIRTPDLWAFPGGKAEAGETPEQTAIREVREEVGLDIMVKNELGRYITGSGYQIDCFVAAAGTFDVKVDPAEIIEAGWFGLKEALELKLISTVRQALMDFCRANET